MNKRVIFVIKFFTSNNNIWKNTCKNNNIKNWRSSKNNHIQKTKQPEQREDAEDVPLPYTMSHNQLDRS